MLPTEIIRLTLAVTESPVREVNIHVGPVIQLQHWGVPDTPSSLDLSVPPSGRYSPASLGFLAMDGAGDIHPVVEVTGLVAVFGDLPGQPGVGLGGQ